MMEFRMGPVGRKGLARAFAAMAIMLAAAPVALPAAPASAQARRALPQRGDYLPAELLRSGPNVDYNAARLRRPPEGYGWFQLGSAFVLASLATGLIVEVVGP
jgi:hypothetical protein